MDSTPIYEIRPGEDGKFYISIYQKEPFWWKKLEGAEWMRK